MLAVASRHSYSQLHGTIPYGVVTLLFTAEIICLITAENGMGRVPCGLGPAETPVNQCWPTQEGAEQLRLPGRLRPFVVAKWTGPLLRTFYDSAAASAIFFGVVSSCDRILTAAGKRQEEAVVSERQSVQTTYRPLNCSFWDTLHLKCVREQVDWSFAPTAVRLNNPPCN